MPAMELSTEQQNASNAPRDLTGEEAALYDRQIRLWGLEAQRKLASSNVLLTGDVTSLAAQEIAKNIVLAGIARLVLQLPKDASASDKIASSFLGSSAEEIVTNLKDMNPLVDVSLAKESECNMKDFVVACAVGLRKDEELRLSDTCREVGVPLLNGRVAGYVGWFFLDVGTQYKFQTKSTEGTTIEREASFCSYRQAVDALWDRDNKWAEGNWHAATVLREFEAANGRLPGQETEDGAKLLAIYEELLKEKKSAFPKKELIEVVGKTAHVVLPPISAIVAGMWGKEVVKIVSGKDEPLNNFFFFNANTNSGTVEWVGPPVK